MGVKIKKRTYNEIFTNGETDWLLGNVGEWQTLKLQVEAGIDFVATPQTPVSVDKINNAFVLSNGGSWGEYGFDDGMIVTLSFKKSVDSDNDGTFETVTDSSNNYTVLKIYGNTMEVQETIESEGFDILPADFGSKKVSEVLFFVGRAMDGCSLQVAHVPNSDAESGKITSLIDNTTTEFHYSKLKTLSPNSSGVMEPIGFQSGMSVRNVSVKQILDTQNVIASYSIPTFFYYTPPGGFIYMNGNYPLNINSNGTYDSARSITALIGTASTGYQSVTDSGVLPQLDVNGALINGASPSQAFIYNAPGTYDQQIYVNFSFMIVSVTGYMPNLDGVRVYLVRYEDGATMNLAGKTLLKEFLNVSILKNKSLNVSGVWDFAVNDGESFVLAVEFFHDTPQGGQAKSIVIHSEGGSIMVSNPNEQLPDFYKRTYEFGLEFMISSLFEDLEGIENKQIPSFLVGDGSITDNFLIRFFPEWNNPNVKIQNDMAKSVRLGNTGWFNENFNQLPNDFSVDSVEYFDLNGNKVESIDYSSPVKVKAVISGLGNSNPNTEAGFGFAWIPKNESDYKEKETPFYRNCFVQSGSITDGFKLNTLYKDVNVGAGINGASMDSSNVKFTYSSGKLVFEAVFEPNVGFFSEFDAKEDDDRNFILWVSIADGTLERNFSNRVALIADIGSMIRNIPQGGKYGEITNKFIEHPYSEIAQGEDVFDGIVQDDVLCRVPFRIPSDGSISFQRMIFGVEVKNLATGSEFVLERLEVDLSSFPVQDKVQQINYSQDRGFKLEPGNNKNWVKVERNPTADIDRYSSYIAYFATKIRWEDWVKNTFAPGDFYDPSELNSGLNNDWVHYLRTKGWAVDFFVKINAVEDGGLKQYKNSWKMKFSDYDENVNIQTAHRYLRDSDNALLNIGNDPESGKPLGVILSNEPTRIEIDFEILDSGVWDIDKVYSVTTIEIDRGAGRMEQRQLSSVWGSESDNPLIPVAGESKLKISIDGTAKILTTSCLVDPDLLQDAVKYRVTGRVGCFDQDENEGDLGLYDSIHENRYD